jgi:murein DD-endopeptidase MepM/ murein hydrolase activator NlpD
MPIRIALALWFAYLVLLGGCASSRPASGVYHTVKEGQTLYRIGLIYQIDDQKIAQVNNIKDPRQLRVGQRLYIPGATSSKEVPVPRSSVQQTPGAESKAKTSLATEPKPPAAPNKPSAPASPPPSSSRSVAARKGQFNWPVSGKVVRHFGQQDGEACRGVQIAVASGTPVIAAAAGRVTFSGDQIRGYGHLIILKHDDAFYTVYGLNEKNLVEVGAQVAKGAKIALSGPRLHFEIRRGKEALNPIFYLP